MTDIFLSYSSKDRSIAANVCAALKAEGYDVFFDQETPIGEDWNAWIGRHLAASKLAVVLWSAASVQSANVIHEATIAKNAGKLLPTLISDLTPEQFPMGFFTVQGADLRDFDHPAHAGFLKLLRAVERRIGTRQAIEAPPSVLPPNTTSTANDPKEHYNSIANHERGQPISPLPEDGHGRLLAAASETSSRRAVLIGTGAVAIIGGGVWLSTRRSASIQEVGGRALVPGQEKSTASHAQPRVVAETWSPTTAPVARQVLRHPSLVYSAIFSPDGASIVTASHDKTARIWDANSGGSILTLRGHESLVTDAAFRMDGARIVTASHDGTARVWDARTGETNSILPWKEVWLASAAFSQSGAYIVAAGSFNATNAARVWNANTNEYLLTLEGHTEAVRSAAFSPDGNRIVTASWDKTARVWDARSGQHLLTLDEHEGWVNSAAFSPDGAYIVTASADNTARIWDARTGQSLRTLLGHQSFLTSAAFSPDGTRISTGSYDNTARVWDARTGQDLFILSGHEDLVFSASFSPDGTRIITASQDNTARVWW